MEFDPSVGMDRLRLVPISRASADQRAGSGRAHATGGLHSPVGRTRTPEPVRADRAGDSPGRSVRVGPPIAGTRGTQCGSGFPWLNPPRPETVDHAVQLLEQLGLLESGGLTDLGQVAARMPVHPRLGRLLAEGQRLGHPDRAALAAAVLSERDPFTREFDSGPPRRMGPSTLSDVLDRVEALEAFERNRRLDTPLGTLHRGGRLPFSKPATIWRDSSRTLPRRAQVWLPVRPTRMPTRPSFGPCLLRTPIDSPGGESPTARGP
jgi:ATP-dependent helicase HrpB